MNICCPNCLSDAAVGSQAASICTECASVSVAGASIGMGTLVACVVGVAVLGVAVQRIRQLIPQNNPTTTTA